MRKQRRTAPLNVWDLPRPAVPLTPQECAVVIGACQHHSHDRWFWELKGSSGDLGETLLRRAGRMAALGRASIPLEAASLAGHSEMWLIQKLYGILAEASWHRRPPEVTAFLDLYSVLAVREGMAGPLGWLVRGQGSSLDWIQEPRFPADGATPAVESGQAPSSPPAEDDIR